jgi:effector-binding domain-containing protein
MACLPERSAPISAECKASVMAEEVRVEQAEPRPLAAIRTTAARDKIGQAIYRALDEIWPVLREQAVRTGHNVVIYDDGDASAVAMRIGVEVFTDFTERGGVTSTATPAGLVATIAHYGDYAAMAPSYAALERWCRDNDRAATSTSWEVYGDWDDDPARRRTDLYRLLA